MRVPPNPELTALADDPVALAAHLAERLASEADADNARDMGAYLKHRFVFFGVKTPRRRTLAKPTIAALGRSHQGAVPFAHACFAHPQRELHYVAVDAVRRWQKALTAEQLDDLRTLVVTNSWWDTVDTLAAHPVGHVVRAHPERVVTMDAWVDLASSDPTPTVDDDALWLARTGILHQLTYKEATDATRLFRHVLTTAHSKEFFLRKAQGWALRTYSRVAPEAVRRFVRTHETKLSGLTVREATKHL